jgi:raffinose/stachyose/melibiose transport system permease protein
MKRNIRFILIFTAPAFIIYTLIIIYPTIACGYFSLFNWDAASRMDLVGLRNYLSLLKDPDYRRALYNTAMLIVESLAIQLPFSALISFLLFRTMRGFKFFRAVYFVPVVIAPIAIGTMFVIFYNTDGPLNTLLKVFGLGALQQRWLSDPKVVLHSVIFPQMWQYAGVLIMILLAALQAVPGEILESALMDGAGSLATYVRILVPMTWEAFSICIILTVTGSLRSFDHPWVMTMGGPGLSSAYVTVFLARTAFMDYRYGYGSAIGVSIIAISLLFAVLFRKFTSIRTGA